MLKISRCFCCLLVLICLGYSQPFVYLNNNGYIGGGYKFNSISPYLGLEWGYSVNNTFNDTLHKRIHKSEYLRLHPLIGIKYYLTNKNINVFCNANVSTYYNKANYSLNDLNVYSNLGIGIEKKFDCGLAIAGEYAISIYYDKSPPYGNNVYHDSYYAIYQQPSIWLIYYFGKHNK